MKAKRGRFMSNNKVKILGKAISEPQFNHYYNEKRYLSFYIETVRKSGYKDKVLVIICEDLVLNTSIIIDCFVKIIGEFRSKNETNETKSKLLLFVFCKEIQIINDETEYENKIYLNGFVCKSIIIRKTPFGRDIADILLAVNRNFQKSDYIPCIAWGEKVLLLNNALVGDNLIIEGRIQSRNYNKESENKIAYEISITNIQLNNKLT